MNLALLNGQPLGADDLRALALVNYGHFTSMQVRGGAAQGLELHRRRLLDANQELFGSALEFDQVRAFMRQALSEAGAPDCTLRVTVFSQAFDYRQPSGVFAPDVLVSLSAPAVSVAGPVRLRSFVFNRSLPHLKHVGTFPLFHYRRLALEQGADDALFCDPDGVISEGSVWNLGVWDGEQVLWPQAPALRGTAEALLQAGLRELGVVQQIRPLTVAELRRCTAAFTCNASGVRGVAGIDGETVAPAPEMLRMLGKALQTQAWQAI